MYWDLVSNKIMNLGWTGPEKRCFLLFHLLGKIFKQFLFNDQKIWDRKAGNCFWKKIDWSSIKLDHWQKKTRLVFRRFNDKLFFLSQKISECNELPWIAIMPLCLQHKSKLPIFSLPFFPSYFSWFSP